MPVRPLPSHPSLDHLRHQAKDLLRQHTAVLPDTAQRIREFHPRFHRATDAEIMGASFKLSDAQLTIARESGFASWAGLKRHVESPALSSKLHLPHHERIDDATFRKAVDLIDAGDADSLRSLLQLRPALVHQHILFEGGNYFRSPTLLEFIAENPVRRGTLPPGIIEVARVILDANPGQAAKNEALMLVATGSVPRECGVQLPLIALLCRYGADPQSAVRAAAVLDELASVRALLDRGATLDLPVAAALGRENEFARLLSSSTPEERHLSLALAAQFGHASILRSLLEAGEDPNRYNPPGGHSHATPLHQAAAAGHEEIVHLLVEHGARLDLKDVLWHATPAGWAAHENKTAVAQILLNAERNRQPARPA